MDVVMAIRACHVVYSRVRFSLHCFVHRWERKMFPCTKWGFDTVVDAIGSNEPKFECEDVILQFERRSGDSA